MKHSQNKHNDHGQHDHNHHAHMIADFRRRFWVNLTLTIPIVALSDFFIELLNLPFETLANRPLIVSALATIVFFYGGKPFLLGLRDELKIRQPGMMTLIGLAIITAYTYSLAVSLGLPGEVFFWELTTLITVMLLGHWLEMASIKGASRALEEISKLLPGKAHRIGNNQKIEDVDLYHLRVGDKVLVKPGEKIPADGVVLDGSSSVNEALLTGESKPILKKLANAVIGGSVNGDGSLTVRVEHTGSDSFIAQVQRLVSEAQSSRSRTQDLANRVAMWLTIIAVVGGLVTFLGWSAWSALPIAFGLERAVTVMIITCPHALGLAIPLVVAVSTSRSARQGLLIRNREAFERARSLDVMVFDKTGTLTEGKFALRELNTLGSFKKEEVLKLAAAVEAKSEHPLAQTIAAAVKDHLPATEFKALPGRGVQAEVRGKEVMVVSPGYLKKLGHTLPETKPAGIATTVFVIVDGKLAGSIELADAIRKPARAAIAQLKELGVEPILLTGDSKAVAAAVARELGIKKYFAEVLPAAKSAKIAELQKGGKRVAMVGDGVNDAPALARADLGIAIGSGTDVAAETADVILVRNDPQDAVRVLGLAKATYRKMAQNLLWATGYNAVAIPLAAGVLVWAGITIGPAVGAALMSASTVIVAINASFLEV